MNGERIARLRAALEHRLQPRSLEIEDQSAAHAGHAGALEGGHFRIRIVAEAFTGHPLLARHRLVYDAVRDLLGRDIHALSIEAYAPEE